jgi:F-type H+-transporting ATPase subunit b
MSFFVAILSILLWAAPAVAAEEEHAASIGELTFPFINFLIFLYLIKRFALPLVKDYFRGRHAAIADAVREADEARERAAALVRDYKNRLAKLNQEIPAIREALRADGEREKNKLLAEAGEVAGRIETDADFLADQETRLARQQLRREIVGAARATAEKLVQDNLTAADQKRIVSEFLSEVGAAR